MQAHDPTGGYTGPPPSSMPGAPESEPQRWQPGQNSGPPPDWEIPTEAPAASEEDDATQAKKSKEPPPATEIQVIQGYEQTLDFSKDYEAPPPPALPPPAGDPPPMEFGSAAIISQEQAREALLAFVAANCCYGSGTAKNMIVKDIMSSGALHYTLETFTEGRTTKYKRVPYKGGYIDGPENGIPPPPWSIPCVPTTLFDDHKKKLEVPHTAKVIPCHKCGCRGYIRCWRCHGCGRTRCGTCGGDGRRLQHDAEGHSHVVPCYRCGGDGRICCHTCGGDGRITCPECDGYCRLKCFIQLKVKFTNNVEDYILEETDMPDHLIRDVGGVIVFEQTLDQVWPINAYPVQLVNENSIRLVEKHRQCFPSQRQLKQRHNLRVVPVSEVRYSWKDVEDRYWVYGNEMQVYAPTYPQQCCWGCQII